MFGAPKSYLSDQGGEFSEVSKLAEHLTTSSHRPMANGKIERFHQELGKACRIHDVMPDSAVIYLRTDEQRLKFVTFIAFHNEDIPKPVRTYDGLIHKYKVGDVVWKFVPKIARKKWHQVYAGPYVIKQLVSDRTMMVGDYKLHSPDIKVHYADLKSCHLPNKNTTQTWRINKELFDSCINEWAIKYHFPRQYLRRLDLQNDKGTKRCKSTSKPNIYHYSTIPFTNKGIEAVYKFFKASGFPFLVFVCPELPCLPFWAQVETWPAKWIALPGRPDDLVCQNFGRTDRTAVGRFPWTLWMVCLHQ